MRTGCRRQRAISCGRSWRSKRELQDGLIAALGTSREAAERAGDFVFCLDSLSLALCHEWGAMDLPAVRGTAIRIAPADGGGWTLDPWPLAVDRLDVAVGARRLAERFDDEATLRAGFQTAPWTRLEWTLRRGEP